MLDVKEAQKIILEKVSPPPSRETVPITEAYLRVLAENVYSDVDMPPFDKSSMDGFAVVAADGEGEFEIVEEIPAGSMPKKSVTRGTVSRIMTGAPIPEGADAVVQVEDTEGGTPGSRKVKILKGARPGQNLSRKAEDVKVGDLIAETGRVLRPQEIAMLASVGKKSVPVFRKPTISILATGDELVEPERVPGLGQIRNSNSYSLTAQCLAVGIQPRYLGIARDEKTDLQKKILQGLDSDFLIITGGVSMGEFDFVPGLLKESGVHLWFHKVKIKPGKPIAFGTSAKGNIVFGLPGNPVSTMVCFEIFVRIAIQKFSGVFPTTGVNGKARLNMDYRRKIDDREEYVPVILRRDGGEPAIDLITFHGSADIMGMTRANGYLRVPVGVKEIRQGETCDVFWLTFSTPEILYPLEPLGA